jgi:glutathione S-transferase
VTASSLALAVGVAEGRRLRWWRRPVIALTPCRRAGNFGTRQDAMQMAHYAGRNWRGGAAAGQSHAQQLEKMPMYLWSGTLSVFSAKVRIAVREKNLPVEIREVTWTRARLWGDKPEALLAVSPRGQVPVLVDDEVAVFDSTIINEYLEERFPEPPLMPADTTGRARCRMWEELADDMLGRAMPVLVREIYVKPEGAARDEAALAAALKIVSAHHARLEQALVGADFLCGAYSLADIGNFLAVAFCSTLGAPPDDKLINLAAWYRRVAERPVVKHEIDAVIAAASAA